MVELFCILKLPNEKEYQMKIEATHTFNHVCVIFICSLLFACSEPDIAYTNVAPAKSKAKFCDNLPRSEYAALQPIDSDSDWFELYKVASGVTAIYEPNQWQEVISYLIEGEQKALLFDTGNGIGDIRKLVSSLTNKPIVVLNSHSHYDHVGDNYQFDTIYGMDTPFTRLRQQGRTPAQIGEEVSEAALCVKAPGGKTPQNHVGKAYKIKHLLVDGDTINLGGRVLQLLHVPGHTPDAIALLDKQNGLMWTGDSFYLGTIWLNSNETDLAVYRQSLDKMIDHLPNLTALLPAHNTPLVQPKILLSVREAFDDMIAGKLSNKVQDGGMREHFANGDLGFSFLMRDVPLPYSQ